MTDRDDRQTTGTRTFVPPIPPTPKVAGSHDNPLEMGAGGENEHKALSHPPGVDELPGMMHEDVRGEVPVVDAAMDASPAAIIGQTDTPLGTGVGYAGEGAASYGTQGAAGGDLRLDANVSPERTGAGGPDHSGT